VAVPSRPAYSPVPPAVNTGSGKTASNQPFFLRTFGEVFGNCGRKGMKKKIGYLPTEFIKITPLNSAEFLYSKGK
jgi:hypothetical protein